MKVIVFLYFLLFGHLALGQSEKVLGLGEAFSIIAPSDAPVWVQQKGIVKVSDQGRKIRIAGKKIGETQIRVASQHLLVKVIGKRAIKTYRQLQKWQEGKRGPEISVGGKQVIITGRLLRLADFKDLANFTNSGSEFLIDVEFEADLKEQIHSFLTNQLSKQNLSFGSLVTTPTLAIKVANSQKKNLSSYKKILKPYGVKVEIDNETLTDKPVLEIKVYIAHLKRSFIRKLGIAWPSEFKASLIPNQGVNFDNLAVSLNALESSGTGKMLATPTLITESHKKAQFHSGGEFPVRTSTQFNNTVDWKKYGLFFNVTPKANTHKHLKIAIDIDLSAIDKTQGVDQVPALTRSQIKTQINMKKPQAFLLSGFLHKQQGNSKDGLPWLSQIPIFSELFSTGEIYDNEYELVFILIPRFYE